jgi:lipoprotein-releasing system permease protein
MPYELFIALRYLRAKRKQVMVSVITVIAIAAVAAGVAALIIVLAMMTGFREEFQAKILSGTAHINLLHKDGRPIDDPRQIQERLKTVAGVRSTAATFYKQILIQGPNESSGAMLKGVDLAAPRDANEVFQFMAEGDPQSLGEPDTEAESGAVIDRIIIGQDLARVVGLKVGDVATILSPEGHLTPLGLTPRTRDFRVAGIFASGLGDYDSSWVYVSLEAMKRFSGRENVVETIQIKVDDVDAVKQIGARVLGAAGDNFLVQDWQELNAPIYTALSYEKFLSGIALLIVIAIAALNIITVLIMIVMEKHRDIAILKSMGATSRSVMWLFMLQGLMIGVVGIIVGIAAGVGFCYVADAQQLIALPTGAYALNYIPFHTSAPDIAMVALVTVLISFLSTVYPSLSAARLDPVEGLRYE